MFFRNYIKDNKGQALSEYALIIALVAIVVIGILGKFGDSITDAFTAAKGGIDEGVSKSQSNR